MSAPCPCCDVIDGHFSTLEAMAYGLALGCAFGDMHKVVELCCGEHRVPFVLAMAKASIAANTVEGEEAPATDGGQP